MSLEKELGTSFVIVLSKDSDSFSQAYFNLKTCHNNNLEISI